MARIRRRPADPAGRALHEGLIGARALVGTAYLSEPSLRAAYARDLAPRTEAALTRILADHGVGPRLGEVTRAERRRLRALDLGSGTGAVGAVLDRYFGPGVVDRVSVDRHVVAPGVLNLDLTRQATTRALGGRFDLVVAGHLLNELFVDLRTEERSISLAELVLRWGRELLAPGGLVVLIEPALRETSRDLLRVRDRLLVAGELRVVAPCLFTGPCPALERERDWCHDAAPGVEARRRVDFSYLVLGRASEGEGGAWPNGGRAPEEDPTRSQDDGVVRVVSDPLVEKGKLRLFVCGALGRFPVVRLDRHASPSNRALETLARGDLARISPLASATPEAADRADGRRIARDELVERLDPSDLR